MKNLRSTLERKMVFGMETNNHIFVIIKPGFLDRAKDIINIFRRNGWVLSRTRTKQLTINEAKMIYKTLQDEPFYKELVKYMSSDPSMGIIFSKPGRISKRTFDQTKKIKDYVRSKWSINDCRNVIHSSDSLSNMERESKFYF